MVPSGKTSPGELDLSHVRFADEVQLSFPVGSVQVATAEHKPGSLDMVILAGQLVVGGSSSVTVTFIAQAEAFPAASVAVNVTLVVPTG